MQQILYQQSPYLVTTYDTIGEAVRSDHFACFVSQPNPGGVWLEQYGVYNYIHIKPAAAGRQLWRRHRNGISCTGLSLPRRVVRPGRSARRSRSVASWCSSSRWPSLGVRLMRRRATVGDRE